MGIFIRWSGFQKDDDFQQTRCYLLILNSKYTVCLNGTSSDISDVNINVKQLVKLKEQLPCLHVICITGSK